MIAIDIAWFDQKEDERGARFLVIEELKICIQ